MISLQVLVRVILTDSMFLCAQLQCPGMMGGVWIITDKEKKRSLDAPVKGANIGKCVCFYI